MRNVLIRRNCGEDTRSATVVHEAHDETFTLPFTYLIKVSNKTTQRATQTLDHSGWWPRS